MSGAQAMTLLEVLYKISCVNRGEFDDPATFARFKYTVGWNVNQLRAVQNVIAKRQQAIMAVNEDEREEYEQARKTIMESYAKRDEKGEIVRDNHGYVFPDSAIVQVQGAIDNLRKKHAAALKRANEDTHKANAVVADPVDVVLRALRLEEVPALVAGGWLPALDPILVDVPGDAEYPPVNLMPAPRSRLGWFARVFVSAKTMLTGITASRKDCPSLNEVESMDMTIPAKSVEELTKEATVTK